MTNFDLFKKEPKFDVFINVAIVAEKMLYTNHASCVINCRRALEFAVKWMYSVDESLVAPYQDTLASLMYTDEFRNIVDEDLWKRINYIRTTGNSAIHSRRKISNDMAKLCLKNLFIFFDFIAYCYIKDYKQQNYDENLLCVSEIEKNVVNTKNVKFDDIPLKSFIKENKEFKEKFTNKRKAKASKYVKKPLKLSEYKTRKIYIDSMLIDAGWTEGKDWINEYQLSGMPNKSEVGYADYVLFDDAHKPLAVIEAKRTCVDVSKGRQQAKLYADILEQKFGRRPVIFLTNGFDTRIDDNKYPERKCAAIYSKRDLTKWFNLLTMRQSLKNIKINKDIAGRYYQEAAIKAVCSDFDERNKRKALLVMATGSGKTRTVIELCDILLNQGWVKNILFLADRNSLVTQAKRSFVNLLPNLSCSNLCEDKGDYNAHCIFSTYQTMINKIDDAKDEEGKVFSCGHFDLVISDEAHRSIYNKYKDIFTYFDAPFVGLTATPKDEIDKNTYSIFELESGVPTYGYELAQAVKDHYLVDFQSVETSLKFMKEGITYDGLSDEEKKVYEDTFKDEEGDIPERIYPSELNKKLFNKDTIRKVLHTLMTYGLKVDYGQKIGKTIIFAKNHNHAEKIFEVFNKTYPYFNNYAKVIDNTINYAQSAIDEFSDKNKLPQIAISVDMLDTGVDVPEILNLVFFKKVMSKAKFWQMIGRGTRLCPGLCDGEDKSKFYIFDFCGNFEFFRMKTGSQVGTSLALQGAIFMLQFKIAGKLQDIKWQLIENLKEYRKILIEEMIEKVREIKRDDYAVKQHIKYVDLYSSENSYNNITYEDTLKIKEELAPLILPNGEASANRFDALMYRIEFAYLDGEKDNKARNDLLKIVNKLASIANISEIQSKLELIQKILQTNYLEEAGISEFEYIRKELRELLKFIKNESVHYETDFADDVLDMQWYDSELENDELENYKKKAEYYIREHQDNIVIAKLKTNKPLTLNDVKLLENILWSEVGTREDYEKEIGEKPLGEFVREIVGLDMNAAKEAFSEFLEETNYDSRQIYFVNQIIEYIVHNGMMKDLSVLQESPFADQGSVSEIFTDINVWTRIHNVIEQINANAAA